MPGRTDPGAPMDVKADLAIRRDGRLSRVKTHANPELGAPRQGVRPDRPLGRDGGGHAIAGSRERGEERIALRVDLSASGLRDGSPNDAPMIVQSLGVAVPQRLEKVSGMLDVGEEEGDGAGWKVLHGQAPARLTLAVYARSLRMGAYAEFVARSLRGRSSSGIRPGEPCHERKQGQSSGLLPAGLGSYCVKPSAPIRNQWSPLLPNKQHRAGGVVHDLVRNTAEQQALPFGHAARTEDDQVRLSRCRDLDDLLMGVAGTHPADLSLSLDAPLTERRQNTVHKILRRDGRTEVDVGPLVSLVLANVEDDHRRAVPLSEIDGDGDRLLTLR